MKPSEAVVEVSNISFRDLRRHKMTIIELIAKFQITHKESEALEGILSLIDAIHDHAIDSGQLTPSQVFGKDYK